MRHILVEEPNRPICPNCKKKMSTVAHTEDFVFFCENSTCEWICGPDFVVKNYFERYDVLQK